MNKDAEASPLTVFAINHLDCIYVHINIYQAPAAGMLTLAVTWLAGKQVHSSAEIYLMFVLSALVFYMTNIALTHCDLF